MDKNQTEIFGEFTYPESMTYFDLLETEEFLKEQLDSLFIDAGAAHLDFTPHGDIIMLQCAFEFRNLEILRDIAQQVAELLPKGMHGRILCLEKNLSSYHLFWIERGQWQEAECKLSKYGPADVPINRTNVIEREGERQDEKAQIPHPGGDKTAGIGASLSSESAGRAAAFDVAFAYGAEGDASALGIGASAMANAKARLANGGAYTQSEVAGSKN